MDHSVHPLDDEFDLSKRAGYKLYEDWIEHVTEDDACA